MSHKKGGVLYQEIYNVVKKIPKGRVTTYGEIAKALGNTDARKVGWALHANRDLKVPCHRVVNKKGRLAPNFSFDGWEEQRRRLEAEGIEFVDEMHVDLDRYIWRFNTTNKQILPISKYYQ